MENSKCKGCGRELRPNESDLCPYCKNKKDNRVKISLELFSTGVIAGIVGTKLGLKEMKKWKKK